LIPVAKASVNALLIHVASRGRASASNSWWDHPSQPYSLKDTSSFLDEYFQFRTDSSHGWLDTIQQFLGGQHSDKRSVLDGFTAGDWILGPRVGL
jgi:hypothetical protein